MPADKQSTWPPLIIATDSLLEDQASEDIYFCFSASFKFLKFSEEELIYCVKSIVSPTFPEIDWRANPSELTKLIEPLESISVPGRLTK